MFVEGVEYTFEDLPGSSSHPLEFFDAAGDPLLSQSAEGSFESDPAVGWEDTDSTVSFTVTASLAAELDGYICTIHSSMEGGVQTTSETQTDLVIAGLDTFNATELDGSSLTVPVADVGGFPGEHTAHLIPEVNLSGNYSPGDVVSNETASAAIDNDTATVYQGAVTFENQTVEGPVTEGDVLAELTTASLLDGAGNDTAYTVDVHPTDGNGNLVGPEYVGSSDVLVGSNTGVNITAEQVPGDGQFNEFPLSGAASYVAMIHLVDDENASEGDPASPGQYPVLPHGSANGTVPGGVTDAAVLEYPLAQNLTFPDQELGADGNVTVEAVQSDGVESAVIITYANEGNLTIAGLTTGIFANESAEVVIQGAGGFPGEHTAHILPVANLSQEYVPGNNVSAETAGEILAQDTANVTEADTPSGDIPLNVTVDPGAQFDRNNFTLIADASESTEDTDIQTLLVDFSDLSGIDTAAITQAQVTVTADGIGDPGVDSVQQNNPGELIVTPQNSFTLDAVTGDVLVTIDGVAAPESGTFTAALEFQDDSNEPAAVGLDNYTIDPLSQRVTFEDQFVDGQTVDVTDVQSNGTESAVVVTYTESEDLVVAGLTVGTFDNETVPVDIQDTGGLPGNHTAHIVPVDGLSQDYQPGDTISAETADNIFDQDTARIGVDVTGDGNTSTDTTGDGRLNDVDGDTDFDIFDVQALFDALDTEVVRSNPALFDFADIDDGRVSISDIQGLFNQFQNQPS
jgi:hypothetical protein